MSAREATSSPRAVSRRATELDRYVAAASGTPRHLPSATRAAQTDDVSPCSSFASIASATGGIAASKAARAIGVIAVSGAAASGVGRSASPHETLGKPGTGQLEGGAGDADGGARRAATGHRRKQDELAHVKTDTAHPKKGKSPRDLSTQRLEGSGNRLPFTSAWPSTRREPQALTVVVTLGSTTAGASSGSIDQACSGRINPSADG